MKIQTAIVICSIFFLVRASNSVAAKEEYFRWVDEKGVTHYDTKSPGNVNAKKIEINTTKLNIPEDKKTFQPILQTSKNVEDQHVEDIKKQRIEECKSERNRLARLEINGRKRIQEDGYRRYLTRDEITEQINEVRKFIREACSE